MSINLKIKNLELATRLDRYLRKAYPGLTQGMLEKLLREGKIRINGKKASSSDRILGGEDLSLPDDMNKYRIASFKKTPKSMDYTARDVSEIIDALIYKDNNFLAINKPYGLAVQGGSKIDRHLDGFLDELKFELDMRPKLVHRLDKDTTGVLLLGRTLLGTKYLSDLFRDRKMKKTYLALCYGDFKGRKKGVVKAPLKKKNIAGFEQMVVDEAGDETLSEYEVLARKEGFVLMKLHPVTGLTHQLRVHMAYLGAPIYGDIKYGRRKDFPLIIKGQELRLHLHDKQIVFKNLSGQKVDINADLPEHMKKSLRELGFLEWSV